MSSIDLNRLRDTVTRNQEGGNTYPVQQEEKIFVDKEGKIKPGDNVSSRENKNLSEVPQETFAYSRHTEDCAYARQYMPSNTKEFTTEEGVQGFLYSIICEFGNHYTLFAHYNGSKYEVILVKPKMEGSLGVHAGHLWSNGSICLSRGEGGVNTLPEAYTKSVLWASGASIAKNGHSFPFAYDQ